MNASVNNNSNRTAYPFITACSASCQKLVNKLQLVKKGLLSEFRHRVDAQDRMLQLALNEAEALARETGFPLLTFPVLAREKAESVAAWRDRQQAIRRSAIQRLAA